MNYIPLILFKIQEFSDQFPEFSIGEILYSVIRQIPGDKEFKKSDVLSVNNEEFYKAITKAMKAEEETEKFND